MKLEVRGKVAVRIHSENLLARELAVRKVAGIQSGIAPIAGPPIHHVAVVFIAREFVRLALRIERP